MLSLETCIEILWKVVYHRIASQGRRPNLTTLLTDLEVKPTPSQEEKKNYFSFTLTASKSVTEVVF